MHGQRPNSRYRLRTVMATLLTSSLVWLPNSMMELSEFSAQKLPSRAARTATQFQEQLCNCSAMILGCAFKSVRSCRLRENAPASSASMPFRSNHPNEFTNYALLGRNYLKESGPTSDGEFLVRCYGARNGSERKVRNNGTGN